MKTIFTTVSACCNQQDWIHVQSQACAGEYILEVKGNNRRRRKRMVQIELRYEEVSLYRPANIVSAEKYPSELKVHAVHVKKKVESARMVRNR